MNLIKEESIRKETVLRLAAEMLTAARTAPKARGNDRLFLAVITDKDIENLSLAMKNLIKQGAPDFFERDAGNLLQSQAVLIIGTSYEPQGLQLCGYCGFNSCEEKRNHPDVPCVFNTGDLGIAIGAAVSIAADRRIDNRIMYSAGYAAIKTRLTPPEVKLAYAIPLSVSAKNPFFDRK